jgi:uncharacterized protein YjbJ (UPF0337 family)
MKLIRHSAALAAALALAACNGSGTNEQAGNNASSNAAQAEVNMLENASSTLEGAADNATGNAADALSNQAGAVSNAADNAASNATSNAH